MCRAATPLPESGDGVQPLQANPLIRNDKLQ